MSWSAPIVFPDVEALCVGYARAALAGRPESFVTDVLVGRRVGRSTTGREIVFRRDGGPRVSLVTERARLGVRVFADSAEDAVDLANLLRGLLAAMPGDPSVPAVSRYDELSGPSAVDDPNRQLRYFVAEVTVRGEPLS